MDHSANAHSVDVPLARQLHIAHHLQRATDAPRYEIGV